MKKYIETIGSFIEDLTMASPEKASKLLQVIYSYVEFSKTHHLTQNAKNTYDYMIGKVAGGIADSFRKPEKSVMVNVFFPCELLHAMDLYPMLPEGISCYLANTGCQKIFAQVAEDNDIPETFCSYHKTMLGLAESGVMPKPLMIANTTLCCDANQLSFRRLAEYYDIPRFVLDVPHERSEDSVIYVADQLRDFSKQLEELTGKRLDKDYLKFIMKRSERTIDMFGNFIDRRGNLSLPSSMSSEMCNMIAAHTLLGTEEAEIYLKKLIELADIAPGNKNEKAKRIFWVHTLPNWQESMTEILEHNPNYEIVGSDMGQDIFTDINPDKPFESMAKRLVYSAFNGFADSRIDMILDNAKKAKADGIIIFCHWGCKQTLGMSQMAKQVLESNGLPTLILDGDGCDSRNVADGQMVTRVNAFLEQLGD